MCSTLPKSKKKIQPLKTSYLKQGLYDIRQKVKPVIIMACWKWFNNVLEEAKIEVTDKNKQKIDEIIHKYIGEQSSYGRCSADWRKARKEIQENKEMKQGLIEKLRSLL
jgi:hypothetical protein